MKTILLIFALIGLTLSDTFNLYSTGAFPDVLDANYFITSAPDGFTGYAVVATDFPGSYVANNANSKWIGENSIVSGDAGIYVYATTFDLTGLDPSTASFTGNFAADNNVEIHLNGVDTGIGCTDPAGYCFESRYPISVSSGFVSGLNVLELFVNNFGGETAVIFEVTGTAAQPTNPPGVPSQQICEAANSADWNPYGQGYYCYGSSIFVQCWELASVRYSAYQPCATGTSCACSSSAQECSNHGTLSPCR